MRRGRHFVLSPGDLLLNIASRLALIERGQRKAEKTDKPSAFSSLKFCLYVASECLSSIPLIY